MPTPVVSQRQSSKPKGNHDSYSHPVYSDYSHLAALPQPDIAGLGFVAGLRMGALPPQEVVARILPMTRIIPANHKPAKLLPLPLPEPDPPANHKGKSGPCMREECVTRRTLYKDLTQANKGMKAELIAMKDKVRASVEELAREEEGIHESERRNEKLKRDIEYIKSRIIAVTDINSHNESLRIQLGSMRQEVEKMTVKTKETQDRLNAAVTSKSGPSVVFNEFRGSSHTDTVLANEVIRLGYNDDDSDED